MSKFVSAATMSGFSESLAKEALNFGAMLRHGRAAIPGAVGRLRGAVSVGADTVRGEGVRGVLGGVSGGAGAGGLVGGVVGAGEGAVKGYREAKGQGASVGQALGAGLGGAVQAAGKRALQGSIAGAALGGGGAVLNKALPGKINAVPYVGAGSRFGQRQLHSLTGWSPKDGIRSIRGGAYSAEKELAKARNSLRTARSDGKSIDKAKKEFRRAQDSMAASEKAERMGLTSLPGYAKALYKDPKGALKAGFSEQWKSMGPGMRALTYGGTAATVGGEALRDEPGAGKVERMGRALGTGASFLAGPLPLAATMVTGPALSGVLGTAGKGVDKLTGSGKVRGRLKPVSEVQV